MKWKQKYQLGRKKIVTWLLNIELIKIVIKHFLKQFHILIGIRKHKDISTAVVCAVVDFHGELAAAVASVEAIVSGSLIYSKDSVL